MVATFGNSEVQERDFLKDGSLNAGPDDSAFLQSFFLALCLGKIPGGAPFSQLHKGGKQRHLAN